MQSKIVAVDLFCGVGGLTHGLIKSGIKVSAGVDIEESCRYAYEKNNSSDFLNIDIRSLKPIDLKPYFKDAKYTLLAGCPPCQPFSTYSRNAKKSSKKIDERWNLIQEFGRLITDIKPDFFTLENVPGLEKEDVFDIFLNKAKEEGYFIDYKLIYCPDYGMGQTRTRLVLIASRLAPIAIIPKTHTPDQYKTVRELIGHLPSIKAGETHKNDNLHKSSKLSKINLERIKHSKPGGTWKDWPSSLISECHKKASGHTYPSVYGRMEWDAPSPTITTQCNGYGNGRFGHPSQDRAISLREAAIFQSFPENYSFHNESTAISSIAKMIGNAVPVKLGEIIGKSFTKHINDLRDGTLGSNTETPSTLDISQQGNGGTP